MKKPRCKHGNERGQCSNTCPYEEEIATLQAKLATEREAGERERDAALAKIVHHAQHWQGQPLGWCVDRLLEEVDTLREERDGAREDAYEELRGEDCMTGGEDAELGPQFCARGHGLPSIGANCYQCAVENLQAKLAESEAAGAALLAKINRASSLDLAQLDKLEREFSSARYGDSKWLKADALNKASQCQLRPLLDLVAQMARAMATDKREYGCDCCYLDKAGAWIEPATCAVCVALAAYRKAGGRCGE